MRIALWVGLALALGACRSAPEPLPPRSAASGGEVRGEPVDLRPAVVLDNRDFVYAIAFSPDAAKVAFTHLGVKGFQLGLWSLEPVKRLADLRVNADAYDVEGVAFSPDGQAVCTASRDKAVRCYSAANGAALTSHETQEPLVSLAFDPSGRALLAGSARGLVTVLEWPGLAYQSEARLHGDEVRSIAAVRDGRVFTGGWDKTIAVSAWAEREPSPGTKVLALEEKARLKFAAYVNDFTVDREGALLGVAFSEEKAERTPELYEREKRGERSPPKQNDFVGLVDARTGKELAAWHTHQGITSTVGIRPDGKALVSGGWDNAVHLFAAKSRDYVTRKQFGWSIRRVRFSEDGRLVAVGAWTPQDPLGQASTPSAVVYGAQVR